MTAPAAFEATVHSLRTVAGRKVVQIVVEAPIEYLPTIARIAEHGSWVAVARLNQGGAQQSSCENVSDKPAPAEDVRVPARAKRRFDEMSPAQQAGMLCADENFQQFLQKKYTTPWVRCGDFNDVRTAANVVREICDVDSRRDINNNSAEWQILVDTYRVWQKYPEHV